MSRFLGYAYLTINTKNSRNKSILSGGTKMKKEESYKISTNRELALIS